MPARQLTVTSPGDGAAILTLQQPLTPEFLLQLEQGLAGALAHLRLEVSRGAGDPGEQEYASWIEQLRSSRT